MASSAPKEARYEDLFDLPPHVVGEIVFGVLHTHRRPAPRHAQAASTLGEALGPPFKRGRGGPGGRLILGTRRVGAMLEAMPVRWLVLVALLLCASCALFVDLGGLSDGAPRDDGGARVDAAVEAGRPDAGGDAGDAGTPIKDAAALPDGAVVFPTNGHAYLLVATGSPIAWSDARSASLSIGGHLATVASQAEHDFLLTLLAASSAREVWIGGTQANGASEPDGGWGWDTGEPLSLGLWGPGEPNNYGDGEACMGLRADGWNDEACASSSVTGYIVELE